jgi:hypothetical protein
MMIDNKKTSFEVLVALIVCISHVLFRISTSDYLSQVSLQNDSFNSESFHAPTKFWVADLRGLPRFIY